MKTEHDPSRTAAVLEAAADRQFEDQLTLGELEVVAAQAGIEARYVREAVAGTGRVSTKALLALRERAGDRMQSRKVLASAICGLVLGYAAVYWVCAAVGAGLPLKIPILIALGFLGYFPGRALGLWVRDRRADRLQRAALRSGAEAWDD